MSLACGSSVPSSPLRTGSTKKKEGYYHTQIRFRGRIGKAIPFVSSPDSESARKTTLGTCPWRKGNRACVGLACGFRQIIFCGNTPLLGSFTGSVRCCGSWATWTLSSNDMNDALFKHTHSAEQRAVISAISLSRPNGLSCAKHLRLAVGVQRRHAFGISPAVSSRFEQCSFETHECS